MSKNLHATVGTLLAVPLSIFTVASVSAQDLQSFGVISGQSLTNTGPTTILGNIAVNPGTSYTGSGSVTQTGSTHIADAVAVRVQNDLSRFYTFLAGRPTSSGGDLTGQDLGGLTLKGGVYHFDSIAGIAAGQTLTLDAEGNPDSVFIFNIGSTLTAESGSKVLLKNDAQGGNVFYRVGSSATLDTSSALEGQIVALTSITMNTEASINCGAALARNGSVTLDTNTIRICTLAGAGFDVVAADPSLTNNDRAVAAALAAYVAGGGTLLDFPIPAALTPGELAQLSGEVSTGVAPTGIHAMNDFLDMITSTGRTPRVTPQPSRDEGVPIGMVREKINESYTGKYGSETTTVVETLSYPTRPAPEAANWDMWMSGYGSRNVTDGDAGLGHHQRTSNNKGIAAGLNFSPSVATNIGVALSWSKADFALNNSMGSGTSATVFLALRGRTSSDRGYVEGAVALGRSDITTNRTVSISGTDQLAGETTGNSLAAHVEAGYHMGGITPFVGLRAQSFKTAAYSETASPDPSSSYALGYEAATTTSVRSELGVDMQWSKALSGGGATSFGVRAAWAHEFATNTPGNRSFVALPGALVAVSGATPKRDSVVLSANLGVVAATGFSIGGGVNMEYSGNARDYGGSVKVGYQW
ncbi:MAG: ice-binding family protein [Paracoccaceae bacterium]